MPLNLASPGIVVREVDLTIGRIDPVSGGVGAIAAPFAKGPVGVPQLIESENDLLETFGRAYSVDNHYEHWMVASSFLAYGGLARIVRVGSDELQNAVVAHVGLSSAVEIQIDSEDDYENIGYAENTIPRASFIAKNPGSWANDIVVATIDGKVDQVLTGISTAGIAAASPEVGVGITQTLAGRIGAGAGTTTSLTGYLKGVITEVSGTNIGVKVLGVVDSNGFAVQDYTPNGNYRFIRDEDIHFIDVNGDVIGTGGTSLASEYNWYNTQSINLPNGIEIEWDSLAPRPSTSQFVSERGGRFDEMHVVVIDATGAETGNAGTILEKHLSLSKAKDAVFSVGSPSYWRKYLKANSRYVFGGSENTGVTTSINLDGWERDTNSNWDRPAEQAVFSGIGVSTGVLASGKNYSGISTITTTGALAASVGDISAGFEPFKNTEEFEVDFILMGSGAYATKEEAQAVAKECIEVAETRKDAIAVISPWRGALLNDAANGRVVANTIDQTTTNILEFYEPMSSSYAIFDSGYKYMYDRFNDTFRYVPLNGDIAGTCVRTDLQQFPWFSPAGTSRGTILNAVKLAYNPGKAQRDILYSANVNPVIFSPGAGIVLFGDKTGFGKASAFDRINVRRLFIYLEDAIAAAAKDQLFEFNDEITRTTFVNIVEPFLRDVQSKRGIFDFVVVCDETNNTAAVIDNNEFIADIFIKPARSINFIGLTFVATRTGVAFEEVIGSV
jgi:hypothetical protein